MQLADVIKSGRPFRRPGWKFPIHVGEDGRFRWSHGGSAHLDLRASWFDETDWEWEPEIVPTVTITAGEFWAAWNRAQSHSFFPSPYTLAKELGL